MYKYYINETDFVEAETLEDLKKVLQLKEVVLNLDKIIKLQDEQISNYLEQQEEDMLNYFEEHDEQILDAVKKQDEEMLNHIDQQANKTIEDITNVEPKKLLN
jgi:hypothetical protein